MLGRSVFCKHDAEIVNLLTPIRCREWRSFTENFSAPVQKDKPRELAPGIQKKKRTRHSKSQGSDRGSSYDASQSESESPRLCHEQVHQVRGRHWVSSGYCATLCGHLEQAQDSSYRRGRTKLRGSYLYETQRGGAVPHVHQFQGDEDYQECQGHRGLIYQVIQGYIIWLIFL